MKRVEEAITSRHRRRQQALLREVGFGTNTIPQIVNAIEAMRVSRKWKATTTLTQLGTLIGAARRARQYGFQRELDLVQDSVFKDYLRSVTLTSIEEEINYPAPMTREQHALACREARKAHDVAGLVYIVLAWATTARPGCVLGLLKKNVLVLNGEGTFTFVTGKGARSRGSPYTVHTWLGPWHREVLQCIQQAGPCLFPPKTRDALQKRVRLYYKAVDPRLEMRSTRRGALECLAGDPTVPVETLLNFSGHLRVSMLMRYLRWGRAYAKGHVEGVRAAQNLW